MSREAYRYRLIQPTTLPMDLVRAHLRLEPGDTADDELLAFYIDGAIRYVENRARLFIDIAEYRQHFNSFDELLELRGPVRRLLDITYLSSAGQWLSLPRTNEVYLDRRGLRSTLHHLKAWPRTPARTDAVRVSYVSGFGTFRDEPVAEAYGLAVRLGGPTAPPEDAWDNYPTRSTLPTSELLQLPADLIRALLLLIGDAYEHREQTVVGTISSTLAQGVDRILQPYLHVRAA